MMSWLKPNFFIVGAAKAGTTSLYQYLHAHPQVYFSPVKEPNYFSTDIKAENFSSLYRKNTFLDVENYFSRDELQPLQLTFVRKPEHYHRLFENVDSEKAIGEASTSYLYSLEAAGNIRQYNPEARIIAIIRNPVKRALSHYQMALRYGHTQKSFRKAIESDMNNQNKGWGRSELFIELGMYYEQLQRFYEQFSGDQLLVLLFDDLAKAPEDTLKQCYNFLNIDHIAPFDYERYNQAKVPRFKHINKWFTESGLKNKLLKVLPEQQKEKLKKHFFSEPDEKIITPDDKAFLQSVYRSDIEKTGRLINRDLSHWMND
jgi:hypothetical protein